MKHLKQGKINWFDVATAVWAIALIVVATTWVAAPAAAGPGGGADCDGVCAEVCPDSGGYCIDGTQVGDKCRLECSTGVEWALLIGCDV